ncbi:MAG TPA: ABC-type transport auxiliary lipoprotein family protein [Rubrivivax sp.]|nr:ABC-type transport auxiliary lipoprotein family protein [Rubrivivax sp.]HPO20960.1 ABC-type transport auxiliary lipoprotein family protein [Rubrivivax sp.]
MGANTFDPRRRALGCALLIAAPAGLAGCTLSRGPRQEFHVLRDGGAAAAPVAAAPIDKVLLVSAQAPPGLYGGDRMVFTDDGRSRSYFQFGFWSERPALTLQALAEARLAGSQRFAAVAASTAGVRGDLLLSLRLDELYLDVSADPGQVRLAVGAELVDWRQRTLLARHRLHQAAAVPKGDAADLAAAASRAMGALLDDLVPWVASAAG